MTKNKANMPASRAGFFLLKGKIIPAKSNCMKLVPPIMMEERIPICSDVAPLSASMFGTTVLMSMKFIVRARKSACTRNAVKLRFCIWDVFTVSILLLNILHFCLVANVVERPEKRGGGGV